MPCLCADPCANPSPSSQPEEEIVPTASSKCEVAADEVVPRDVLPTLLGNAARGRKQPAIADVSEVTRDLEAGEVEVSGEISETAGAERPGSGSSVVSLHHYRTRSQSWCELPQSLRGITLRELWAFHDSNKGWLTTEQWRCDACKTLSPQDEGPCPLCDHPTGVMQLPNLYEVNKQMILPACDGERISYVEHLARQRPEGGLPVRTFVSHWWGEEFHKFVLSLDRYASVQCAEAQGVNLRVVSSVCIALMCPMITSLLVGEFVGKQSAVMESLEHPGEPHMYNMHDANLLTDPVIQCFKLPTLNAVVLLPTPSIWGFVNIAFMIIGKLLVMYLSARCKRIGSCSKRVSQRTALLKDENPMDWTFWICALCNNQYAVEHAVGVEGDVMMSSFATALKADSCTEMAVVLDRELTIYHRIWCAFELFFADVMAPHRFGKRLKISLVNERGVVSDGDCSRPTLERIGAAIDKVRTHEAQASVASDAEMIRSVMEREGTTHEELDSALRDLAASGLEAASVRRAAPLSLFTACPALSLALTSICAMPANLKTAEFDEQVMRNLAPSFVFYLSLAFLIITLMVVRCRRPQSAGSRKLNRRVAIRVCAVGIVTAAPAMLGSILVCFEYFMFGQPVQNLHMWQRGSQIHVASMFLIVIFGLVIGVVYSLLIRDRPSMAKLRQDFEDVLLG
eukprot:TRINITY_DN23117_c0_g1_i2.p1 TRINITY_DN23117_c0_g1~~TRINITY_DN23117_c0_g1_i2.p1  ORF type:complete len:683 (-),score=112.13 TRINITY_DN23117_c0_g1_i2:282-2330(-)